MHHQIVSFLLVVAIIAEVGKTWYKPREIIRDDKGVKLKIYIGIIGSKTEHIVGKFFTRADDKVTIVETETFLNQLGIIFINLHHFGGKFLDDREISLERNFSGMVTRSELHGYCCQKCEMFHVWKRYKFH